MNLTERRNYILAINVSLIFHLLLLLLYIPGFLASKRALLETFPVGLVEIAPGSLNAAASMVGSALPGENVKTLTVTPRPEKKRLLFKSNVIPKLPPEGAIKLSQKGSNTIADGSGQKVSQGETGQNGGSGGSGTAKTGKSQGFGTGDGMVTVLGPMPSYPKNAMNEGKEGDVALRILVKADGSLEQVTVTNSSGDLRLDKAARGMIERTWKFKPVTQDYYIDLVFSFNIQSGVSLKFLNSETRP